MSKDAFIELLKTENELRGRKALAEALGVSGTQLGNALCGLAGLPMPALMRLAELTKLDPMLVVLLNAVSREKDSGKREFLRRRAIDLASGASIATDAGTSENGNPLVRIIYRVLTVKPNENSRAKLSQNSDVSKKKREQGQFFSVI